MFFCQARRVISAVLAVVRALMTRRCMAKKQHVLCLGFGVDWLYDTKIASWGISRLAVLISASFISNGKPSLTRGHDFVCYAIRHD